MLKRASHPFDKLGFSMKGQSSINSCGFEAANGLDITVADRRPVHQAGGVAGLRAKANALLNVPVHFTTPGEPALYTAGAVPTGDT